MTDSIPRAGWPGVRVFVPCSQRSRVIASGGFGRIDALSGCRVFPEELAADPDCFVVSFRASMLGDLSDRHLLRRIGDLVDVAGISEATVSDAPA